MIEASNSDHEEEKEERYLSQNSISNSITSTNSNTDNSSSYEPSRTTKSYLECCEEFIHEPIPQFDADYMQVLSEIC